MFQGFSALFSGKNKVFPQTLSSQEKERGRKLILRFHSLNGISVAFLLDNILIVYSIRNGLPDPLVAVVASFVLLTMPFMFLGKSSGAKIGLARTWALAWFFRYIFAAFMIGAPIIAPYVDQWVVSALIVFSVFGFSLSRSMGMLAPSPLSGEVTTPDSRGDFLSKTQLWFNISQLISMVAIILITRQIDDLWVYQILIGFACVVGIISSFQLAQIPESIIPKRSAEIPFKKAFTTLWGQKQSRKLLFAWSAVLISFMMVIPFMMIGVKSGYGISDYSALTFALLLIFGGIVSSMVNGMILDLVGPRPIILINLVGLFIPAIIWATASNEFTPILMGVAFFIAGYSKLGMLIGLSHYFLSIVIEDDRVGSNLFIRVFSGAAAGLAGTVIGGGLLSLLESIGMEGIDIYRSYFRIILVVVFFMLLIVRSLEKFNEWNMKSIMGLFASPRDLYATHLLKRFRSQENSKESAKTLKRLGDIGSLIPEQEIRRQLDSPLLSVRVNALHALAKISFGKKTEDAVMQHLSQGEHTSAWIAAEILGKHKVQRSKDLLIWGLGSSDHFLQGKCMVALVRLEVTVMYPQIIELFVRSDNPRIIIHGAKALRLMDDMGHLKLLFAKSIEEDLPRSVVDEVLTSAAAMVHAEKQFYQFLKHYNANASSSTHELISDLDAHYFRKEDFYILGRGADEPEYLPKLSKLLQQKTKNTNTKESHAVGSFFDSVDYAKLPAKTVFCIALVLSINGNIPSPIVD